MDWTTMSEHNLRGWTFEIRSGLKPKAFWTFHKPDIPEETNSVSNEHHAACTTKQSVLDLRDYRGSHERERLSSGRMYDEVNSVTD